MTTHEISTLLMPAERLSHLGHLLGDGEAFREHHPSVRRRWPREIATGQDGSC